MNKSVLFLLVLALVPNFLCGMEGPVPTYQADVVSEEELAHFAQELSDQYEGEQLWGHIKNLPQPLMAYLVDQKQDVFEKIALASVIKEELAKRNIFQVDLGDEERKNNRKYISWLNKKIKEVGESYLELTIKNESDQRFTLSGGERFLCFITPNQTKFSFYSRACGFCNFYPLSKLKAIDVEIGPKESKKIKFPLSSVVILLNDLIKNRFKIASEDGGFSRNLDIDERIKGSDLCMNVDVFTKHFRFMHPLKMAHEEKPFYFPGEDFVIYGTKPYRIIRHYKSDIVITKQNNGNFSIGSGGIFSISESEQDQEVMEPLDLKKHPLSEKKPISYVDLNICNEPHLPPCIVTDYGVKVSNCGATKLFEKKRFRIPGGKGRIIRINLDNENQEDEKFIIRYLYFSPEGSNEKGFIAGIQESRIEPLKSSLFFNVLNTHGQLEIPFSEANVNPNAVRHYKASFTVSNPPPGVKSCFFPTSPRFELVGIEPVEEDAQEEDCSPLAKKPCSSKDEEQFYEVYECDLKISD